MFFPFKHLDFLLVFSVLRVSWKCTRSFVFCILKCLLHFHFGNIFSLDIEKPNWKSRHPLKDTILFYRFLVSIFCSQWEARCNLFPVCMCYLKIYLYLWFHEFDMCLGMEHHTVSLQIGRPSWMCKLILLHYIDITLGNFQSLFLQRVFLPHSLSCLLVGL